MNSNENPHEPLVERALVSFDLAAEHHIAHCQPCQTEREKVEDALRQFGAANREYANRPTSFYEQQAARIRSLPMSLSSSCSTKYQRLTNERSGFSDRLLAKRKHEYRSHWNRLCRIGRRH